MFNFPKFNSTNLQHVNSHTWYLSNESSSLSFGMAMRNAGYMIP